MLSKYDQLKSLLDGCGRTLVAYSGGVDSAFLAKVAHDVLGEDALAVIADSPSLPRRELAAALDVARQFGFTTRVIATEELADDRYASNPPNRCYFCKGELFEKLNQIAIAEGCETIVYGENASDVGDFRPGATAASEYQVRAPLKEIGLTKAEIRALSAELGLPTADKPQMACLSSRIPHGEPVTVEALAMIEAAENVLRDAGFRDVRVRHHAMENPKSETRSRVGETCEANPKGYLARIEVGADEMGRFLEAAMRERIATALAAIGYRQVTLDLQGYRRGSMNVALTNSDSNNGEQT